MQRESKDCTKTVSALKKELEKAKRSITDLERKLSEVKNCHVVYCLRIEFLDGGTTTFIKNQFFASKKDAVAAMEDERDESYVGSEYGFYPVDHIGNNDWYICSDHNGKIASYQILKYNVQ